MNTSHTNCLHFFPDYSFAQNDKICQGAFISLCNFLTGLKKKATYIESPTELPTIHELDVNWLEFPLTVNDDHTEYADIDSDNMSSVASTILNFYQCSNTFNKLPGSY